MAEADCSEERCGEPGSHQHPQGEGEARCRVRVARGVDDSTLAGAAVGPACQPVARERQEPLDPRGAAQVAGAAAVQALAPTACADGVGTGM